MMILAFDQAPVNTGFCYGESVVGATPTWGAWKFPDFGDNSLLLIRYVQKVVLKLCQTIRPKYISYETFFLNKNSATFRDQACVAAAIESIAALIECECFEAPVDKWRDRALGAHVKPKWAAKGYEKWLKDAAKAACLDRGWLIDNEHAAEAALIWEWACAAADPAYNIATKAGVERVKLVREDRDRAFNGK